MTQILLFLFFFTCVFQLNVISHFIFTGLIAVEGLKVRRRGNEKEAKRHFMSVVSQPFGTFVNTFLSNTF